jgi:hypothetical protein
MGDTPGMVKSGYQPKLAARLPGPLYKGCATMKSKLLLKKSYGVNQSREEVDGQRENDSSRRTKRHGTPPNPVNPAVDAEARKGFPSLLTRNYRRAWM